MKGGLGHLHSHEALEGSRALLGEGLSGRQSRQEWRKKGDGVADRIGRQFGVYRYVGR